MEQFANINYFGEKECINFINSYYSLLLDEALFKVKKYLMPYMLAMAKHVPYDLFRTKFVSQYIKFNTDPIWGVRRVCIELMSRFLEHLKPNETSMFITCIEFLKEGLKDESKWVKNQAFHQFGKIIYTIFEKSTQQGAETAKL